MRDHKGKLDGEIKVLAMVLIFLITVFSATAITDSDSSNNQLSVNVTVIETRDLTLFFTTVNEIQNRDNIIDRNINFLNSTYPLSDTGIKNIRDILFAEGAENLSLDHYIRHPQLATIRANIINRLFYSVFLQRATNAIGIVPNDYLSPENATGINFHLGGADVVLIEENQLKTLAHEVGHTFELCDEYDLFEWRKQNKTLADIGGCPNGDLDGDLDLGTTCSDNFEGCPTSTFAKLYEDFGNITDNTELRNIMGASDEPNYSTTPPSDFTTWISNDSYVPLMNRTNVDSEFNIPKMPFLLNKGKVIGLRFYVGVSGVINWFRAYESEEGYINNASQFQGTHTLELLNESGGIISNISFTPNYEISVEGGKSITLNQSLNFFSLPVNNQTISKIVIKNATTNLSVENASANTPNITITSPSGGEIFDDSFTITWNASDLDNDTIQYAVLISSDNGNTFSTLKIDYLNTSLTINSTNFIELNQYKIKILATDGINTGNDISETFTNKYFLLIIFYFKNDINNLEDDVKWKNPKYLNF